MGRLTCLLAVLGMLAGAAGAAAAGPRLAPQDARAIRAVLKRYIPAVLERKDVRLGYALSGPQVRGSTTLRDWQAGEVPVYPFPARPGPLDGWTVTYAAPGDVGLDLLLQPREGSSSPAIAFRIEMTKIGGAWKVNAFYPEATFDTGKARVFSPQDATNNGATSQDAHARISGSWLVVAGAALGGLVLLVPLAWLVVARRRDQAAYRDYVERTRAQT